MIDVKERKALMAQYRLLELGLRAEVTDDGEVEIISESSGEVLSTLSSIDEIIGFTEAWEIRGHYQE